MEHRYIEQVFNLTIENLKGVGIYLLEGDIDTQQRLRQIKLTRHGFNTYKIYVHTLLLCVTTEIYFL